ncbi:hypothetical protein [Pseudonocardia xinjiangensis]|uniref:Uncharacterized protein n=1 Tax=Pseudonocardia xinjiangensis TaxID=75289 RepID=A0ABX1RTE1_9PSEU|nr:hypothetical protein [Pseudonocardia xinjiangensis]NMH82600.1 hypothetical protein [Pseudonocardia xinjiangensis]
MNERETIARRYGEHLTDRDLLTLARGRADQVPALRRAPALVLDLLDRPGVADAVLAAQGEKEGRFSYVSPFLVFAAAVHRVGNSIVGSVHVTDRAGPRSRVPVFDAPVLAAFATEPRHRLFLAELLASYARVASGVVWRRGEQGWRRQRWDELDLPRLAALLDAVPAGQQPGVWRRIGDGALFLAGVFPEYAERSLGLVDVARLQRATGLQLSSAEGDVGELLEELAGRAYERVGAGVPRAVVGTPRLARRVLTLVADRYLFPMTDDGFLPPGR